MAVLPDTDRVRSTPQSRRGIASVQNAGAVGRAVQGLGGVVSGIGDDIQDGIDEAAIKERDAYVSSQIRELLYNPDSGFTNLYGKDAVSRRAATLDKLEKMRDFSTEGMSNQGKSRLEGALNSRIETARQRIDVHTSGERRTWLQGASDARITAAFQDSLTEDGVFAEQFSVVEGEIRQTAQREGWSTEKTELEVDTRLSEMATMQVKKMAANDPESALEYLNKNPDVFLPSEALALENTLEPMAKEAKGRRIGRSMFLGGDAGAHQTKIEYRMGPKRPHRPNEPIMNVVGAAAQDVFGQGARIVVISGQEGANPQHGSNRHKTGDAVDFAIYRADGTQVMATDPDMKVFAKAAAARGARGVGFGSEYMGGRHIHVDLVNPGKGQDFVWASGAKAMRGELISQMNTPAGAGGDIGDILEIEDPIERKAALQEFNAMSKAAEGQRKVAIEAATQVAFEHLEAGNSVNDMPLDVRQSLGMDAMSSLRTYQGKISSKEPITTDPSTYVFLRGLQSESPQDFARLNMLEYVDDLSQADFRKFVDAQSKQDVVTLPAASTLMSTAKRQAEAAGLDTSPEPGSVDAEKNAALQTRLLKWQDDFSEQNGRAPSQLEMDERISQELLPIVINPPGLMNEFDGTLLDIVGSDLTSEQLLKANTDVEVAMPDGTSRAVPTDVLAEIAAEIENSGQEPTPQRIMWALIDALNEAGAL